MNPPRGAAKEFLRDMFAPRADPYEGADLATSRRVLAALFGLSSLISAVFLPLEPVDEQIGSVGWVLAGAILAAGFVGAVLVLRRAPSFDDLLVIGYAGVVGIAVLNWLAGGGSSAYEDLLVLWLGAGAAHPPRRAFAHLAFMIGILALPILYEGASGEVVADMVAEALLLFTLGSILIAYLHAVRRQRVGLRAGAEVERRLARVDALTGLGNRRAFDEVLTAEVAQAARDERPVSVGLVDIDNLKRINDRYGHVEGDRTLREVGRLIEGFVRSSDRCFRWGGAEFVVVLPGRERSAADEELWRMVESVARACETADGRGLELTWGAAELTPGSSPEDVLAAADVALLERKAEKQR
jgi:diguanylate cyclase (GGDEF)-like protein